MGKGREYLVLLLFGTAAGTAFLNAQTQLREFNSTRDRWIAFADDKTLSFGDDSNGLKLWDLSSGKPRIVGKHALAKGTVKRAVFASNLAVLSTRSGVQVLDLTADKVVFAPPGFCFPYISADGKVLVGRDRDFGTQVFETATFKEVKFIKGGGFPYLAGNGKTLAFWSADTVSVMDTTTGEVKAKLEGQKKFSPVEMVLSHDGGRVVSRDNASRIFVWDVPTRTPRLVWPCDATAMALSPDGKTLAQSMDANIFLWDLDTDRVRALLRKPAPRWQVHAVAFSPNGKLLASLDGAPRVWDLSHLGPAPKIYPLWPNGGAGAVGKDKEDQAHAAVYLAHPDKATGAAVVIFQQMDNEGKADWESLLALNRLRLAGVACIVVEYRKGMIGNSDFRKPRAERDFVDHGGLRHPIPLQTAQRAIRFVRSHAKEWGIDPEGVGVMGFMEGGHIASTLGTHFDKGNKDAKDELDRPPCRPDFMILVNPVIGYFSHLHSAEYFERLFDRSVDPKIVEGLCNDKQVKADTPPTFLAYTEDEARAKPDNSKKFHEALQKFKVPVEIHGFKKRYPVPSRQKTEAHPPDFETWPDLCVTWLEARGILKK